MLFLLRFVCRVLSLFCHVFALFFLVFIFIYFFFFRFALGAWSMALVLWQPHLSIIIFWVFCFGHLLNLKKFATSCKYTHAQM